jgi:hypothetical protein
MLKEPLQSKPQILAKNRFFEALFDEGHSLR